MTPSIDTFATRLEDVGGVLLEDFPEVGFDERLRQVDARQRHIQHRWRQYPYEADRRAELPFRQHRSVGG